ncbi:DinB family protein [Metabacillus litoralis]|uniref:DinB family protein n=1 Tax=Metabacillus litoralis TaxID=152268 RepID=UPI000EF584C3|nr:DinB family protein [Metabacillus litoralis]MCM3408586.1 DinB family protein [Metabacillus litoralis]UHA59749.1 DinB family protein [Metabacillus litoralis]
MFQTKERFIMSWQFEATSTQKLLNQLTDDSLNQEITPNHWTLGRVAWHIVTAIRVISSQTNLRFEGPSEDFPVPTSSTYISESYKQSSQAFTEAIQTQWSDHNLQDMIEFFGQKMPVGTLLLFLLQHQTHHRGQLTVLMRQAGIDVSGVYGPSKDEWAVLGMEAPKM